jgi:hypothetical protein
LVTYEIRKKMGSFDLAPPMAAPSPFQKLFGKNAFIRGTPGTDGGMASLTKLRAHIARILQDTQATTPCLEITAYDLIDYYFDESDRSHKRLRMLVDPPWVLLLLGEKAEVNNKLLPELIEGLVTSRNPPKFTWVYTRKQDGFLMERYGSSFYEWLMAIPQTGRGTVSP